MATISETVPGNLQAPAEAARAWFSDQQDSEFKVTGIVEPADPSPEHADTVSLQLILCGRQDDTDVCLKEQFEVTPLGDAFKVQHLAQEAPVIGSPAPDLDPPIGTRDNWLSGVLEQHRFVVLLFYRGLW